MTAANDLAGVMRHEPQRLMQGLCNDDAIKRVAMERRQRCHAGCKKTNFP